MTLPPDLEQARHVFELLILTALADGGTEDAEARVVSQIRKDHPIIAAVADPKSVGLAIRNRMDEVGLDAAVKAAAAGLEDRHYQESAFQLCAKVMGADGETDMEEAMMLGELQELFGFTPADVKRLLGAG